MFLKFSSLSTAISQSALGMLPDTEVNSKCKYLKSESKPVDEGTVPYRLLVEKSRNVNEFSVEIELGILPCRLENLYASVRRPGSPRISPGMDDWFSPPIENELRETRAEKVVGKTPDIFVLLSRRSWRAVSSPILDGITPVTDVELSRNVVRECRFTKDEGILP